MYQVLVNQIVATMGKVKRAPRKTYKQSKRKQSTMTGLFNLRGEVLRSCYSVGNARERVFDQAGKKWYLRRRD